MSFEAEIPHYVLADEETGEVLVKAIDISGFFVSLDDELPAVVFRGVREINERCARTEDGILEIIDRRQTKVGEYFVGRAVRGAIERTSVGDLASTNVSFRSFANRCEHVGAQEVWRHWVSNVEPAAGEWLRWPIDSQEVWLHVVQNSWFARGLRAGRYGTNEEALLDGDKMPTRAGFYCALGEAVNGPRGYFGSNLDALEDCLSANYGAGRISRVSWRNFPQSQEFLGSSFLDSIFDVMREFDVELCI